MLESIKYNIFFINLGSIRMATAEQLKSLISAHFSDNEERFYTISLQIAAHEAKLGHGALSHDIREILDKQRINKKVIEINVPQDLQGLILTEEPEFSKASLVISQAIKTRIDRILQEFHSQHKLKSYGLKHRRKILLAGAPGTGKTMTAKILAHELSLPLHIIQLDRVVTKFMGETSAKLRQIFDMIQRGHGIYFFDEFDAIGGERSSENDVGEMRRVLNAFLQFIEQDKSDNLIIAATNNPHLLDNALFRRFDDILYYGLPEEEERRKLIKNILGTFVSAQLNWEEILKVSSGLSHAEIDHASRDAIKTAILSNAKKIDNEMFLQMLKERHNIYSRKNN